MARKPIPDGAPMSARTIARRRKAQGLSRAWHFRRCDDSLFESWTPELAWALGLIWTDGAISRNTIEFSSKDSDVIDAFAAIAGCPDISLKNGGRHLRVCFTSRSVAARLRAMGLHEGKSFTIRWPKGLPVELDGHFLRGLIDGDGWVSIRQDRQGQSAPDLVVGFCSASEGFIQDVQERLGRHGISVRIRKPTGSSVWRFEIRSQDHLRRLYALIQPGGGCHVSLVRKGSKFLHWMSYPRTRPGNPNVTKRERSFQSRG